MPNTIRAVNKKCKYLQIIAYTHPINLKGIS